MWADDTTQRARVRYSKTGKLRFISAIDLGRVWERALRQAGVPIAYSEGFSPHPKVSFTDALPLGYASTGEYAELAFAAPVELATAVKALNATFPDGMQVLDARAVPDRGPRFAKQLRASCWDLDYPADASALAERAEAVLRAASLPVLRERKGQAVEVDLRPALHAVAWDRSRVRVVLHHLDVQPVRPTEVHLALAASLTDHPPEAADGLPEPVLVTRVAQGAPCDDGLLEALSGTLVPTAPLPEPAETDGHLAPSRAGDATERT